MAASPDDIQRLREYLEDQMSRIEQLGSERYHRLFKKILLVAFLDSLAAVYYPAEKKQGTRFVRLIREHAEWKHGTWCSAPQLSLLLKDDQSVKSTELRTMCIEHISRMSSPITLDCDIPDAAMDKILPVGWREEKKWRHIKDVTHYSLFYIYRCHLVHEFVEPGRAPVTEIDHADEPYYIHYCDLVNEGGAFAEKNGLMDLQYPTRFFLRMAKTCAQKLVTLVEEYKIDILEASKRRALWKSGNMK